MTRKRAEPRVFFPWERRRGVFGALGRARVRLAFVCALAFLLLVVIHRHEKGRAAVRATRATLTTSARGIQSYRADHANACPPSFEVLVSGGYLLDEPVDAWDRPLRLVCPGRMDPAGFDLSSDGPDGLPGGLDRVQ